MTNPDITQKEKKEILENDRKVRATYHSIASADATNELGGRFAAAVTKTKVVGASPWRCDPCGVEPALGYSVNDQPTTGEWWEVEQSMKTEIQRSSTGGVDDGPPVSVAADVGRAAKFKGRI
jgi:hypothetical protein